MPRGRRKTTRAEKLKFVADHKRLWDAPDVLRKKLKQAGLYSASTYKHDINVWALISEARALDEMARQDRGGA